MLVLPGFLVRVAVPPGFMPAVGQGASLTMAMCSGHVTPSVVVQLDEGTALNDHTQQSPSHREAPCVFAATAGGASPSSIVTLVAVPATRVDVVLPMVAAPAARPAIRAHAPRAPPAHV
jgi:hypothetical protein